MATGETNDCITRTSFPGCTTVAASQDAIAARLLAELVSEDEFDAKIASTADKLARLSEEALKEYRAGETLPLDPDEI